MRPCPRTGLCGAESQALGQLPQSQQMGHSLVLDISLLHLVCPCSSHDKRVVFRETCLV